MGQGQWPKLPKFKSRGTDMYDMYDREKAWKSPNWVSENRVPYTNQVIIMFSVGVFTSFSAIERLEAY